MNFVRRTYVLSVASAVLGWFLLFDPNAARAQNAIQPYQEYANRLRANEQVSALKDDLFGDAVSLFNGQTEFANVDIDLPGNNALPVQLRRRLPIVGRPIGPGGTHPFAGVGNWDVDVPYIAGTFDGAFGWNKISGGFERSRCSYHFFPGTVTGMDIRDIFSGFSVHLPGAGDRELFRMEDARLAANDGETHIWTTRELDSFTCTGMLSGIPGEGFVMRTTAGLTYTFNRSTQRFAGAITLGTAHGTLSRTRTRIYLLATRVEDRFGNYLDYSYDGSGYPLRIASSDGRTIDLTYASGRLASATADGRTWNYGYNPDGTLSSVTLPDQKSKWSYGYAGSLTLSPADWDGDPGGRCLEQPEEAFANFKVTITHPSGAVGAFDFETKRFYRSGVPLSKCIIGKPASGGEPAVMRLLSPFFYDVFSLTNKAISGPGLQAPLNWHYLYATGTPSLWGGQVPPAGPCGYCSYSKVNLVEQPDGTFQAHRFGNLYSVNEGRPLSVRTLDTNGIARQLTEYTYVQDTEMASQPFPDTYGLMWGSDDPASRRIRPVRKTVIKQDGTFAETLEPRDDPPANPPGSPPTPPPPRGPEDPGCEPRPYYTCPPWLVAGWDSEATSGDPTPADTYTNEVLAFDSFARPKTIQKFSSLGYSKTETTTYYDNLVKWFVGQIASITDVTVPAQPIELSRASYDPTYALQLQTWRFGKLTQTLAYNTAAGPQAGTVATVKDGNNNVVTLLNWARGIPQEVRFPPTIDQPTSVSKKATVDARGWIVAVRDENGYETTYHYDELGRVDRVDYPVEETFSWAPTITTFAQSTATDAKYGIPGGHWRQTTQTGASRKVTYFDALWRPLVSESWDDTNATTRAETRSVLVQRYDQASRLKFQGYPQATLADFLIESRGTTTEYDILGRPTKTMLTAEAPYGVLTSTTEYLSGLRTRTVSPKHQGTAVATTTAYMAWDAPATDMPVAIAHPEAAYTDILRDRLGMTTRVTRRNASSTLAVNRSYVYDAYRQVCKTIEPETGATVLEYDAAGNVLWSAAGQGLPSTTSCDRASVDPAAKAVRTYDARNRLKTLGFSDQRGNQTWEYTKDSLPMRVLTINDPAFNNPYNTYDYYKRRLLKTEVLALPAWYTFPISYEYDANASLAKLYYPSGHSVDYAPNALGQATKASTYAGNVKYWPNGAVKSFAYGNGLTHLMQQNERQLPMSSDDSAGIMRMGFQYDRNGNTSTITDYVSGRQNRTLLYDGLDRLKTVASPMYGAAGASYEYNVLDDLTRVTAPGRDHVYAYDAARRLFNVSNFTGGAVVGLGYDPQGNLANKNGQLYDFDYGNRLRETTGVERYRYDASGRRILANKLSGAEIGVIYSQYGQTGQLLYQEDLRVGKHIDHVYLAGSLIAQREVPAGGGTAVVKYQHTDALGTPIVQTDSSGLVMANTRAEYEAYGKALLNGPRNRPGYTGHVEDVATNLAYMQQRYYDPGIGRFLSADPVSADGNTGGNFNRYWYAANNPYRFTDPDGRAPLDQEHKRKDWSSITAKSPGAAVQMATSARSTGDSASRSTSAGVQGTQQQRADSRPSSGIEPLKSCDQTNSCVPLDQVDLGGDTLVKIVAIGPAIGVVTVVAPEVPIAVGHALRTPQGREALLFTCQFIGACQGVKPTTRPYKDRDEFHQTGERAVSDATRRSPAQQQP